jgi:hypothetical protein
MDFDYPYPGEEFPFVIPHERPPDPNARIELGSGPTPKPTLLDTILAMLGLTPPKGAGQGQSAPGGGPAGGGTAMQATAFPRPQRGMVNVDVRQLAMMAAGGGMGGMGGMGGGAGGAGGGMGGMGDFMKMFQGAGGGSGSGSGFMAGTAAAMNQPSPMIQEIPLPGAEATRLYSLNARGWPGLHNRLFS